MRATLLALLLLLVPVAARAQDRTMDDAGVPRRVRARVRAALDDDRALHVRAPATIPGDSVVIGDLVAEGGELRLDGRVTGDVYVVGGDLDLGRSSAIEGDVIVIGGAVRGATEAYLGGTLLAFAPAGTDEWTDEERYDDRDWRRRRHRHRRDANDGHAGLVLRLAPNYDRVEGLPLLFGPQVETRGPNRTRLESGAVWRSEPSASFGDEDIGYDAKVEQRLAAGRLRIGATVSSLARPIEERGIHAVEASLAAAALHRDLHDYYRYTGWAAYAEWAPPRAPLSARLAFRDEEHGELEVSDPWTLFNGKDDWRVQPMVANGDVRLLDARVRLDTRDEYGSERAARGWYLELGASRALDQSLATPALLAGPGGTAVAPFEFERATIATVDLRHYTPIDRNSALALRVTASGAVDDSPLAPQFQRALGGSGTLPGYGTFVGDCGARAAYVQRADADPTSRQAFAPAYGCDRVVLGQVEYRGGLHLDFGDDDWNDGDEDWHDWHDWWDDDLSADWVVFADVGRGWALGDLPGATRTDTETMADVGIGLLIDEGGVYAAIPLQGDDRSLRLFLRFTRRF